MSGATGSGSFVGSNSPTITTPQIAQINDTNGNEIILLTPTASAVNFFSFNNKDTGHGPVFAVDGSDSNVGLHINVKGTGTTIFGNGTINSFTINNVASAVNSITVSNSTTGNSPTINATGTDTNIGLIYNSKGTGNHGFYSQSVLAAILTSQASAVNYFTLQSSPTGFGPNLYASGSDSNVAINFLTKGTGGFNFIDGSSKNVFTMTAQSSAVNYFNISNAATLNYPSLNALGSDANVSMYLNAQGTGTVFISNSSLKPIANFDGVASAANNLQFINAAANNAPSILTIGSDSNIQMLFKAKGTGGFLFQDSGGANLLQLIDIASSVNYFSIVNNSAGNHPHINVNGSDSNINVRLVPKGTGVVFSTTAFGSAPPVSTSSSLSVGSAYQNTQAYDVVITVYLSITAATSASILLGVGSTNTPTQQTILSSFSTTGLISIPIYIPAGYFALLSTSGTITQTISGQITMAV